MSYCRFSSDGFRCDLYIYEYASASAFMTHVAGRIGLPYDGQTFIDPTLEHLRDRVIMLREAGYHVPDNVLQTIDEDIAAEQTP